MNVAQLAEQLRKDNLFMKDVTRWEVIPARPAMTVPFPDSLDPRLIPVLAQRGIHSLYTHQAKSLEAIARGEDVTVVTPTASGKTMCCLLIGFPRRHGECDAHESGSSKDENGNETWNQVHPALRRARRARSTIRRTRRTLPTISK